jgi:hypothetical protein
MQHIVVKITKPQTDYCAKIYGKQSVVFFAGKDHQLNLAF